MKGKFESVFQTADGNLVLHGFDTAHDLKLCEKALERMLRCLSETSIYNVNKVLEPYRRQMAREMDKEIKEGEQ